MPKVSDEHLESRWRQVLDAASLCFARKGFHATTMQDICAEAQLSPGAVYRYFTGKDEIIEAICRATGEQYLQALSQALEGPDVATVLQSLADFFFPRLDGPEADVANRSAVQVWAEAVTNERVREVHREHMETACSMLHEVVRTAGTDIEDAGVDADALARVMVSIYNGFVLQKALDPSLDTAAYTRAALFLFTRAFGEGNARREIPAD